MTATPSTPVRDGHERGQPGMIGTAGMKIFRNAAINGVRCEADRSSAESARWNSAFVVH